MEVKMIYVYFAILAFYFFLFLASGKEKVSFAETEFFKQGYPGEKLFLKAAGYLRRKRCKEGRKAGQKTEEFSEKQLGSKLKLLHPALSEKMQLEEFHIKRDSQVLAIFFLGNVICLCIAASGQVNRILLESVQEGSYIPRNGYGQGEKELVLEAQIEGEEAQEEIKKEISYTVEERFYTEEEIDFLYEEAVLELMQIMLGENAGFEQVTQNLILPEAVEGYPFSIYWESDSYSLLQTDGTVLNESLAEPEIVNLTAHFQYAEMAREEVFSVQVCPAVYTEEELWIKAIQNSLEEENRKSKTNEVMYLPKQIGNRAVTWKEVVEDGSSYFFLLLCIGAVLVYYQKGREIDNDLEKRNRALLLDYSEIISKLLLYMGAGMTIRNAFQKMGEDYKKKRTTDSKRYVYEEILLLCYELQSGVSETEAYTNLGKRCQMQSYMKLCTLLSQNLKKGSNDLLEMLRQEAFNAFAERKSTARKLGEEAGTKLLIPMIMMLCIVMVLIMIPAYFSFTG